MDNSEKEALKDLEERTRQLEKAEKRHSFLEGALLVLMVVIVLFCFNGCRFDVPEPNAKNNRTVVDQGRWVETRAEGTPEDLTFSVASDGNGIEIYISGAMAHLLTVGDTYSIFKYRMLLTMETEEGKMTVFSGETPLTVFDWTTP